MGEILRPVELGWYAPKAEFAPFWWRECLSTQPVKRLEFALSASDFRGNSENSRCVLRLPKTAFRFTKAGLLALLSFCSRRPTKRALIRATRREVSFDGFSNEKSPTLELERYRCRSNPITNRHSPILSRPSEKDIAALDGAFLVSRQGCGGGDGWDDLLPSPAS
jgi:hypothetical protein